MVLWDVQFVDSVMDVCLFLNVLCVLMGVRICYSCVYL